MDKNESFAERMMRKQGWNKGEGKLVSSDMLSSRNL